MNDTIESDELTKKVQEVEDPEKAAEVIHECESIYERRRKAWFGSHIIKARFLKILGQGEVYHTSQ